MVDFPLASMVTLSWYFLLKTKKFTNTKYSSFFGISAALGMLAKFTYFIYIFPYFVFLLIDILYLSRRNNNRTILNKKKLILSNLILASVLFLIISSFWYFFNLKRILLFRIDFIEAYISKTSLNYGIIFVIRRLFLIAFMLLKQLGTLFFLTFFFSLIYAILNFKKEGIKYLLLWFSFPILFLSINVFLLFKRYLLPILPAIAIICSFFLFQVVNHVKNKVKINKKYWNIFLFFFTLICLLIYIKTCFPPSYLNNTNEGLKLNKFFIDTGRMKPTIISETPDQIISLLNFSVVKKLNRMAKNTKSGILIIPERPFLTELCNQINIKNDQILYDHSNESVYNCKSLTLCIVHGDNFCDEINLDNISTMEEYFKNADFIITKNNGTFGFENLLTNKILLKKFIIPMMEFEHKYTKNKTLIYKSPPNPEDNYSSILIYK
jgi:hypothetical protein